VKPRGVVHIGASSGQEIPTYVDHGIMHMVMVEALPEPYGKLLDTAFVYRDADIKCLNECVADVDGKEVTFHISDNDCQSSSFLKPKEHLKQHPTVHFPTTTQLTTITFPTMCEKHGIDPLQYDFLNMDIQGAELHVLKGMGEMVRNFKWIYLETNYIELYEGCGLALDIDNYLVRYGFEGREEKRTGHGWGDKCYVRV